MRLRLTSFLDRFLRQRSQPAPEQPRRPRRPRRSPAPSPRPSSGRPQPTGALAEHGLPDADFRTVRIDYDPCLDGDPDPGEVVWAWVSFEEDPTQGKDRPVVVIGRAGEYLAALALTTKGHNHHDNLPMGTGPWDGQGRESYAKLDRVLRIDPAHVRREGSILDRVRFDRLVAALRDRA